LRAERGPRDSAFPLAFRSRSLSRPIEYCGYRAVAVPGETGAGTVVQLVPKWDVLTAGEKDTAVVNFVNVDGGTISNEPLDFVRVALAELEGHNKRQPKEADRAIILIDPFSDPEALGPREPRTFSVSLFLLSSRWFTRRASRQPTLRSPTRRIYTAAISSLQWGRWAPMARRRSAGPRLHRGRRRTGWATLGPHMGSGPPLTCARSKLEGKGMKYVCDAYRGKTWFRIETEAEAAEESRVMQHKVEKYFCQEKDKATKSFQPSSRVLFEQEIGLTAHIQREMPLFLTLRDAEGKALVTAMLPPSGRKRDGFSPIIVGAANSDPYPEHADAIKVLGDHFSIVLDRARCYPYGAAKTRI
jgi:hypothetical protein